MKVKLIVLDVDGVMTDGKKYYGLDGLPFAKTYCDKDFTAIKRFKGSSVRICLLSGDDRVNRAMASNRNIDFYSARGKDKKDFLPTFLTTYAAKPSEIVYIGDDLFDSSILKRVGYPFCPSDACYVVKKICGIKNILESKGGDNVICELFEVLLDRGLVDDCEFSEIEKLDKKETF